MDIDAILEKVRSRSIHSPHPDLDVFIETSLKQGV